MECPQSTRGTIRPQVVLRDPVSEEEKGISASRVEHLTATRLSGDVEHPHRLRQSQLPDLGVVRREPRRRVPHDLLDHARVDVELVEDRRAADP